MSQNEILEHLEKNKNKWFTTLELVEHFKIHTISGSLTKLRKWKFVKIKSYPYIDSYNCSRFGLKYKHKELSK